LEKDRQEKERLAKDRQDKLEKEKQEKERLARIEKDRQEKELLKEKMDKDRQAKLDLEKQEQLKIEQDHYQIEKSRQLQIDQERQLKMETDRQERLKIEKDRQDLELATPSATDSLARLRSLQERSRAKQAEMEEKRIYRASVAPEGPPIPPRSNRQTILIPAPGPPIPSRPQEPQEIVAAMENGARQICPKCGVGWLQGRACMACGVFLNSLPEASPPSNYIEQGYLFKKGDLGVLKTWKKRYFSIRLELLVYHEDDKTCQNNAAMIGFVPLHKISSITVDYDKPNVFKLIASDRIWYLRGETKEIAAAWIDSCNFAIARGDFLRDPEDISTHDLTVVEGEVRVGGLNWKLRYLVLRDGIFHLHKSANGALISKTVVYKASLREYTTVSAELPEPVTDFKIVSADGTELIVDAMTEDKAHHWMNNFIKHKTVITRIMNTHEIL